MIVTGLEPYGKNKVKVYLEEEYYFMLYNREIYRYGLKVDKEISDLVVKELNDNMVKRAKQKVMALLKSMNRTEAELRSKLALSGYREAAINEAIEYVKNYHYIDDSRYAVSYIRLKKQNKSRRQIIGELKQKGVSDEEIEEALDTEYDNEEEAIKKEILKKAKDVNSLSREEKQKLAAKLYRKGYGMDLIKSYVKLEY
jgi:regulatory protein